MSNARATSVRKMGAGQSPSGGDAPPPCIARLPELRDRWLELAEFVGHLSNNRLTRAAATAIDHAFKHGCMHKAGRVLHCAGHELQGVAEDDSLHRSLVNFSTAAQFFLDNHTTFSPAAVAQDTRALIEESQGVVGVRQRMSTFHGRPDDDTMNRSLGLGWNVVRMAAEDLVSTSEALYNGIHEGLLSVKINDVPILLEVSRGEQRPCGGRDMWEN